MSRKASRKCHRSPEQGQLGLTTRLSSSHHHRSMVLYTSRRPMGYAAWRSYVRFHRFHPSVLGCPRRYRRDLKRDHKWSHLCSSQQSWDSSSKRNACRLEWGTLASTDYSRSSWLAYQSGSSNLLCPSHRWFYHNSSLVWRRLSRVMASTRLWRRISEWPKVCIHYHTF